MTNYAAVPQELRDIKQWVAWKREKRTGSDKPTKVPYVAEKRKGRKAKSTDPSTWRSFDAAREAAEAWGDGVGFVFSEDGPYAGVDLDNVRDPQTGAVEPWAQELIEKFDSYTELSQSGTGFHILVRGRLHVDTGTRKRSPFGDGEIEIYDRARYFATTGDMFEGHDGIEDREEALRRLYDEVKQGGRGSSALASAVLTADLILDPKAEPPDRFLVDVEASRKLRETFSYGRKKDLGEDPSAFDFSLALQLLERGYSDQEIADTIITFRRRHKLKWPDKALRPDYIPRTLARAREAEQGAGQLAKLPFPLERRIQYGKENARYELVLEDGERIVIPDTETMMSGRRMRGRLAECGYVLSPAAVKAWDRIVDAMIAKTTTEEVDRDSEVWFEYVDDYLAKYSVRWVDDELGDPRRPCYTRDGLVYIRSTHFAESLIQRWRGTSIGFHSFTPTKCGLALAGLGFKNEKRALFNIWRSPAGFARERVEAHLRWEEERVRHDEALAERSRIHIPPSKKPRRALRAGRRRAGRKKL